MGRSVVLMFLAVGLGINSGCRQKAADPTVLAKVGNREIRVQDFEAEVAWRVRNQKPLPEKQALLDEMIGRELLLQKARQAGLEDDPDIRHSYESMLASKLRERILTPRLDALKVSSEEIQARYEKELPRHTRSAKARLAMILIKTDPKMSSEQLAEAEQRIHDARKLALTLPVTSQGFGKVAVDYSEDQGSRYKGGDVGWFDKGQTAYRWPAEVVNAGFLLNTNGAVSEVIRTPNGFYLVSKLDTRDSAATPLVELQGTLQRRLITEKRQEAEAAFRQELRAAAAIQSYPQGLAPIHYPVTSIAKAEDAPPALPSSP